MNSVKNANSQSHEWLREINHFLPLSCDGEACHSQIRFLKEAERAGQWGAHVRQAWGLMTRGCPGGAAQGVMPQTQHISDLENCSQTWIMKQ